MNTFGFDDVLGLGLAIVVLGVIWVFLIKPKIDERKGKK